MAKPIDILFITADQWRGDCLLALGHGVVETPNLDDLAADPDHASRVLIPMSRSSDSFVKPGDDD